MEVSPARDARSSSPLSEPDENVPSPPAESRRKSGRATRKPELFSQVSADDNAGNSGRSKRKRATPQDEDNEDDGEGGDEVDQDEQDASESEESEGEADEEELREKRRAAARRSSGQKKKSNANPKSKSKSGGPRAAKKPKITNGFGTELAIRPAVNGRKAASRPKKARAKPGQIDVDEDGLFGRDIFSLAFSVILANI